MEKLLSFILPAYNVQEYIGDCLASLVQQDIDKDEYEIIVVDDGSTDSTKERVEAFINRHNGYTIKLISKENGGVSSARNVGFEQAYGKYIWFVDPDDFLLTNSLGRLRPYLEEGQNIIYLDAKTVAEGTKIDGSEVEHTEILLSEKEIGGYQHCGPWTRIVSRQFLIDNDIRFCERLAYGEDFLWNHLILQNRAKADKEYYVDGYIYYYRLRQNSAYRKAKEVRQTNNSHYMNLVGLAEEYQKLALIPEYNNGKLRLVTRQAKAAAIFSLVFLPKDYFKKELKRLKLEGMYPYGFIFRDLLPSVSIKHTIVGWLMFLLPIESYAKLLNLVLSQKESKEN